MDEFYLSLLIINLSSFNFSGWVQSSSQRTLLAHVAGAGSHLSFGGGGGDSEY